MFFEDSNYQEYIGKQLSDDFEELAEKALQSIGECPEFECDRIVVPLFYRSYYTQEQLDEMEEEFMADWEEERDEYVEEGLEADPEADPDELEDEFGSAPEFECEEKNWSVSCHAIIDYFDEKIVSIGFENQVYGDDGLGDFDPGEVYTDDECSQMDLVMKTLLEAIVQK